MPDGTSIKRAKGAIAYITPTSIGGSRPFTDRPFWWNLLPKGTFERGHLIAGTSGGAGGTTYENLAPQYIRVNDPVAKACETYLARIADECGYCVTLQVTPIYDNIATLPNNIQPLLPSAFEFEVVVDCGTHTAAIESWTEIISNDPSASAPARCDLAKLPCRKK